MCFETRAQGARSLHFRVLPTQSSVGLVLGHKDLAETTDPPGVSDLVTFTTVLALAALGSPPQASKYVGVPSGEGATSPP